MLAYQRGISIQFQAISSDIRGEQSGAGAYFSPRFFGFALLILILPLLHIHLLPTLEF
jgi:hypothetical protein